MSWEDHKSRIEGIRKVRWDALWHVLYRIPRGDDSIATYDRVDEATAKKVLKNLSKWSYDLEPSQDSKDTVKAEVLKARPLRPYRFEDD